MSATSPNRKYRKKRDCNYESQLQNFNLGARIIEDPPSPPTTTGAPVVSPLARGQKEDPRLREIELNKEIISQQLYALLQKSPDDARDQRRRLRSKAKLCGITTHINGKVKTGEELMENFKLVLQYISELDKFKVATGSVRPEDKIFAVHGLAELAQIFGISGEGKSSADLQGEILEKITTVTEEKDSL